MTSDRRLDDPVWLCRGGWYVGCGLSMSSSMEDREETGEGNACLALVLVFVFSRSAVLEMRDISEVDFGGDGYGLDVVSDFGLRGWSVDSRIGRWIGLDRREESFAGLLLPLCCVDADDEFIVKTWSMTAADDAESGGIVLLVCGVERSLSRRNLWF